MTLSPLADLDRHADERPDDIALATLERSYTFAELRAAVNAVASRLRIEGVKPRDVVGIDVPTGVEWIIDLALLRLATRGVSLRGVASAGDLAFDVWITTPGGRGLAAPVLLEIDELWIANAVSRAAGPPPLVEYPRPDSICRLLLTSGTTGMPRAAAYSVSALESRRAGLHRYWTDDRPEVNFMGLSTTGGIHTAIASLNHGQAFRAVDAINEQTMRFVAAQQIQVICGSPMQVAAAVEVLVEHSIDLLGLREVRMAGAAPSPSLLRLLKERLGVPVRSIYGSTEGGGVTMRFLGPDDDPANAGPPLPTLEVQIVDDSGEPVRTGIEGAVRYRGPGLVSGYLENNAVEAFPRGWFMPGDRGMLDETGSVVLAGRSSELVNLGGLKIDPARVDELAMTFPGVRDAATFEIERRVGIPELAIAVVTDPGCDLRALDRYLRNQLKVGHPTAFWQVAEIARNRMGKVERTVLASEFTRKSAVPDATKNAPVEGH